MKRFLASSILAGLIIIAACSKNDEKPSQGGGLVNQPEAIAANDAKSGGVYKGVILGSSGTLKIVLQNNTVSAVVTIDGVTKSLSATNLPANWTSGSALTDVTFSGENGTWTLSFSVEANGQNPSVEDIVIPGHTGAVAEIAKETSTFQIKAYEGRYGNGESETNIGTWNFVAAHGDSLLGVRQIDTIKAPLYGTVYPELDSVYLYYWPHEIDANGSISGDSVIFGTWRRMDQQGGSGRWRVRRTL